MRVGHLLDERNTSFEIHAEVDELPDDSFLLVLLLLKDEHVMVEELLQTLVGVVDAQLLECVVLQTTHTHTQGKGSVRISRRFMPPPSTGFGGGIILSSRPSRSLLARYFRIR